MLTFALLDAQKKLINTIIADSQEDANALLELHNAASAVLIPENSFYNEATGKVEANPVNPQEPVAMPVMISRSTIMQRFTMEELTALYTAAKTNVVLEVWLDKFKSIEVFDVTDVLFNTLVDQQIVSAERLAELLA